MAADTGTAAATMADFFQADFFLVDTRPLMMIKKYIVRERERRERESERERERERENQFASKLQIISL